MAGLSDDLLLRVGLALQKYRQHSPDSDIPVPRYVAMGSQSAGKTRLISTLARTKIGGAEKMHCGTRCPVEYTFEPNEPGSEPEFRFGTSVSDLNPGSASDVARFVTQHMDKLAQQERVNGPGFSTEPIFVQVKSPGAEPLVATDCPGWQGQDNEENNACIRTIYKAQLEAHNSVAVIVSALPATLDMQQITKELEEFVRNAKLPKDLYRGALLLVNRLDAVKTSLDKSNEPLREFQKQAEEKYGLSQEHMGFMCLVPEVLGNQHSTRIVKDDAPIDEQNKYFASLMWEVEKQALQHFSEVHLGQERPPDNVGVHACIGLVHADLKRRIMLGFNKVLESLRREWSETFFTQWLLPDGGRRGLRPPGAVSVVGGS